MGEVRTIGRALGLRVPEIVFAELDPALARTGPDPEIQDLIRASAGLNLGLDYLPGSVTFDPVVDAVGAELASSIVWLDAYLSNVDRTARNTNMLIWHGDLWLIDHGAALYFHHGEDEFLHRSADPFKLIEQHVLLAEATMIQQIDRRMSERLTSMAIAAIVAQVPDAWRADRQAVAARALSLAGGGAEHDHPDRASSHGPVRRSGSRA